MSVSRLLLCGLLGVLLLQRLEPLVLELLHLRLQTLDERVGDEPEKEPLL
jgi:hypothetical protein